MKSDRSEEREKLHQLNRQVADQLLEELRARSLQRQQFAALIGVSRSQFSSYLNAPVIMSPEFIRKLAKALPEEFGWAWTRFQDIVAPEGLAANPGDSDRIREGLDRSIEATRELLKQLRMVRNQLS